MLLIIFMVTANFIVRETVEVDLPRAANGGDHGAGPAQRRSMDRNGTLYVDGAVTDEAGLRAKSRRREARPDTRAIISADQSLPYGRVMHLIDLVKGEGIASSR